MKKTTDTSILDREAIRVKKTIIVQGSARELYKEWRDLPNLPRFIGKLREIEVIDKARSHWVAEGPGGAKLEWNVEITVDTPSRQLSWRSLPGADMANEGSVKFSALPSGKGTRVTLDLIYSPPAGFLGLLAMKLFSEDPAEQAEADLRRFKALMEETKAPKTKSRKTHK